jgi:hypothetical protein
MPYKSDAQRKFFHTDTAKKAGITEKDVNEFDKASKGKKLPEHVAKMAEGGEVKEADSKPSEQPNEVFHNSINADWESLKSALSNGAEKVHQKFVENEGDNGNLKGLQDIADKKAKGYADGGEVDPIAMMTQAAPMAAAPIDVENGGSGASPMGMPSAPQGIDQDFINKLNAGTAMTPSVSSAPSPISQASQTAQNIPPTDPSIYQGISADDRAALMQKLLAQKSSPGMMAASGVAGLGDAITSAFGKSPTNAQGNLRQAQQQNVANQAGVIDTQRAQRMQDMQANLAQQENDPSSPYSAGMRQFYSQLTGKTFPSGISASMMKSAFPDYAKIFDSQLTAATTQRGQTLGAQEKLATKTPWQRLSDKIFGNPAEEKLAGETGINTPAADNGGWSVKR